MTQTTKPGELPASLFKMMKERSEREAFAAQQFAAQYEHQKEDAHDAAKRMTFLIREVLALNDFELKAMAAFGRFFWTDDTSEREQFLSNLRIILAGVDENEATYHRVSAVLHDWLQDVDLSGVDTGALVETIVETAAK